MIAESRRVDAERAPREGRLGGESAEERAQGTSPEAVGIVGHDERLIAGRRGVHPRGSDPRERPHETRRTAHLGQGSRVEVDAAKEIRVAEQIENGPRQRCRGQRPPSHFVRARRPIDAPICVPPGIRRACPAVLVEPARCRCATSVPGDSLPSGLESPIRAAISCRRSQSVATARLSSSLARMNERSHAIATPRFGERTTHHRRERQPRALRLRARRVRVPGVPQRRAPKPRD